MTTTTHTRHVVPIRRTHILRHSPEAIAAIVRGIYTRGDLLTRPVVMARHDDGEVTVRFDVREFGPAPQRPHPVRAALSRAWARPAVRRSVYVVAAIAAVFLTGHLIWLMFADEITAALWLIAKAVAALAGAALLVALALRMIGGGDCPGAHCPPGMH